MVEKSYLLEFEFWQLDIVTDCRLFVLKKIENLTFQKWLFFKRWKIYVLYIFHTLTIYSQYTVNMVLFTRENTNFCLNMKDEKERLDDDFDEVEARIWIAGKAIDDDVDDDCTREPSTLRLCWWVLSAPSRIVHTIINVSHANQYGMMNYAKWKRSRALTVLQQRSSRYCQVFCAQPSCALSAALFTPLALAQFMTRFHQRLSLLSVRFFLSHKSGPTKLFCPREKTH